jgi:hypothetical protein
MSYQLFIDDERQPTDVTWVTIPTGRWVIARSFWDVKRIITDLGIPEVVSFDHDLADAKTGLDCARYIYEYCLYNDLEPPKSYTVHSMNPVGAENITRFIICILREFNKD